jgi:hypothetical protein
MIGTWVDAGGYTWVFKADGTGTTDNVDFKFFVVDKKFVRYQKSSGTSIFYISLSSDGQTLILENVYGSGHYWLTKK